MKLTELFGCDVFNDEVMRERLPKAMYQSLMSVMDGCQRLTLDVANAVANAMKDWAVEKGATHYTHWFQPMTGVTAEMVYDRCVELLALQMARCACP